MSEHTIKLMTYNLKFASPTFDPPWNVRREWQVDLIRKHSPDVLGTQEGLKEQIDYLQDHLDEYVVVGEGRKGGDDDEHMAVFYRRDRFRLREMGSFQLSETPDIIGSGPANNPRMVAWMRLAIINRADGGESPYPIDFRGHWENTQELYVFNTHFAVGKGMALARRNSARLILDRIHALDRFGEWTEPRPLFLMGDFNARPDSDVYRTFVGDADNPGPLRDSLEGGTGIDWILSRGNVQVRSHEIIDDNVNGVYPSDHKPVMAEFDILTE